jgi:hypothetical protein
VYWGMKEEGKDTSIGYVIFYYKIKTEARFNKTLAFVQSE